MFILNELTTKTNEKSNTRRYLLVTLIMLYCLFALNRIKYAISVRIDGAIISNVIIIILIGQIFFYVATLNTPRKINFLETCTLAVFLIQIPYSILRGTKWDVTLLAVVTIVTPFVGYKICKRMNSRECILFLKAIILLSGIYALLTLVISSNYNVFASLLHVSEIGNYGQFTRINMPFGSSISVSYFLNISTPFSAFCIDMFSKDRKWKLLSLLSLIISLVCILVLVSRAAFIVLLVSFVIYLQHKTIVKSKSKNFFLLILIMIVCAYYFLNYADISRIFNRAAAVVQSDNLRMNQFMSAMKIFKDNILFGTGIGNVYPRAYSGIDVYYNGMTLLTDPHNAYAYILSEIGILGTMVTFAYISSLFIKPKDQGSKMTRFLYMTLLAALLLQSIGGSHMINEPAYAFMFWCYLGLTNALTEKVGYNIE